MGHLGSSWSHLGVILGHLGASEPPKHRKTRGFGAPEPSKHHKIRGFAASDLQISSLRTSKTQTNKQTPPSNVFPPVKGGLAAERFALKDPPPPAKGREHGVL